MKIRIVREMSMVDVIIEICASIAEFFVDLWLNKIMGRFKKKKGIMKIGHQTRKRHFGGAFLYSCLVEVIMYDMRLRPRMPRFYD